MKTHRKTVIIAAAVLVVAGIALAIGHTSKKDKEAESPTPTTPLVKPLNISIMLDLSDRLIHTDVNNATPQWERDTTIIGYLCDAFIDRQAKNKIQTGDRIRVFCYPYPQINGIRQMSDSLNVDLALDHGKGKMSAVQQNKKTLLEMRSTWSRSLSAIYDASVPLAKGSEGSDVWGFFDRFASKQCIDANCRNILVIFTDGYLYHPSTWQKTPDGEHTGISPLTINAHKSIKSISSSLSGLEVLFLEVNPKKPSDFGKMNSLLSDWCHGMGIEHVDIIPTDMPSNNRRAIIDFVFGK